jgi:hypothetical protein
MKEQPKKWDGMDLSFNHQEPIPVVSKEVWDSIKPQLNTDVKAKVVMADYYTPTVEEFHDGFEYDYKIVGGWDDRIFDIGDFPSTYGNPDGLEILLKENRVRVKHLDQEDILALGWWEENIVSESSRLFATYQEYVREHKHTSGAYWSMVVKYYGIGKKEICIRYVCTGGDVGEPLFRGNLLNKSELKRLMRQIGIKS